MNASAVKAPLAITAWFTVVVFGRLYTVLLVDFLGSVLGLDFATATWLKGMPLYLWFEMAVYGPLSWFALRQVLGDVFSVEPADPDVRVWHQRRRLLGEFAIAIVLYGVGIHMFDAVEVLTNDQALPTTGSVYAMAYFIDEGLSHYIQFVPLFFVLGWFVINDRPGRTEYGAFALFLGVAHAVERSIGIIEGEKWFLGPPAVAWYAFAIWWRYRSFGAAALSEFFVRYAMAFCVTMPLAEALYFARFDAFPPLSHLSDAQHAQVTISAIVLTGAATLVLGTLDRWWRNRRAAVAT